MSFDCWWEKAIPFDIVIIKILEGIRHPVLDLVFSFFTFLANPLPITILSLAGFCLLFYHRNLLEAIYLNLSLITTWIIMSLLKLFFARPRPIGQHLTIATGMSFPSGHAMLALVFYGFIAYLIIKKARSNKIKRAIVALFTIIILLIGISRIYLKVHYPTDVIAGYLFGAILLCLFIKLNERHLKNKAY